MNLLQTEYILVKSFSEYRCALQAFSGPPAYFTIEGILDRKETSRQQIVDKFQQIPASKSNGPAYTMAHGNLK